MRSSPIVSRTALRSLLSFISYVSAQSVPGAQYFAGSGAPGAASYQLVDDYQPATFFDNFNFFTAGDPTYGHVQYVSETVAVQNGLVYVSNNGTAILKPDTTNKFPNGGPGRLSVRVISDNTYQHGLFVADLQHIPWGCGTWPAYWLLGPDWPQTGEIDIIEGVNLADYNTMSLHSSPNCTIAGSGQTGTIATTNCDTRDNGNSGCGSELRNLTAMPNNYGEGFNANGGGIYVTEWTSSFIKHWWFPRDNIPETLTSGSPDVSLLGVPAVNAQGDCDIDSHFQNMSIIINIDFCGAFAGNTYGSYPNCPQTPGARPLDSCVNFVGNNPTNLTEAYFEFNSLRVYQMPLSAATTSFYSTSLSSVTTGLASTNTIPQGMGVSTTTSSASSYTGSMSSGTHSSPPPEPTSLYSSSAASSPWSSSYVYTGISTWQSDGVTYSSTWVATTAAEENWPPSSSSESAMTTVVSYTSGFAVTIVTSATPVSSTTSPAQSSTASPAPPCPTSYVDLCGSGSTQTMICSSESGVQYAATCGIGYYGTIIDDVDVGNVLSRNKHRRYVAVDPGQCQTACDYTSRCTAANFVQTDNCTLFSSVQGTYPQPGGVAVGRAASLPASVAPLSYETPITQTQTVASVTTTVTGTSTFGLPTTYVSEQITVTPTTVIVSTLPPGGTVTSVVNGSSTSSYYVFGSSTTAGGISLCYTCGIVPTLVSGTNLPTYGGGPFVTPNPIPSTCPVYDVRSGTGYTTVYTTYTQTLCGANQICPNPGYVIIGGGGSMTSRPGQVIVTTTNAGGSQVTYTQVPTTTASATRTEGGGGGGGGGEGGEGGAIQTGLPVCPYANGEIYVDPMGQQYTISCDTIFSDVTIETQTQVRLGDCMSSCDAYNLRNMANDNASCWGVSFKQTETTDNCLLKTGTTPLYDLGVHSAKLISRMVYPGSGSDGGNWPPTGPGGGTGVPTTVVGSTVYSTYVTTGPGGYTVVATQTIVSGGAGGATIVTSVPLQTGTNSGNGPGYGYGTESNTNPGTGPGATVVSTAYSTYVTAGVTIVSTYGVTTVYATASTNTVTTTTVSVSISNRISTATATATISGPTITTAGGTATVTQAGPTITASGDGGGGGGGGEGGTVTVTNGSGGSGGSGGGTVTEQQTVTLVSYVMPSQYGSGSSVSFCRTYATQYYNGKVPTKKKKRTEPHNLFDLSAAGAQPAARLEA